MVDSGQALEAQGDLQEAETAYKRAIGLDQKNSAANYHLGRLYADLGRTERAQNQLLLATEGDFLPAYTRLATLYLENENPDAVIPLLMEALGKIEDTPETATLRAELWSNLGWARVQQGRYAEAEENLTRSIAIENQIIQSDTNPSEIGLTALEPSGEPYCLLFQTAQASGDRATAEIAARSCIAFADTTTSQADQWVYEARTYLQEIQN
ncbi:MAG: tetratricopeptide repeat protein [Leptolyngbya sp. SIO1D8]|nr:tetratricopeptide repeat protein [Leptolyngbya sp. SIO1D8]